MLNQDLIRQRLSQRARELVPILRERALNAAQAGQLPEETLKDFQDAGFFRITPREAEIGLHHLAHQFGKRRAGEKRPPEGISCRAPHHLKANELRLAEHGAVVGGEVAEPRPRAQHLDAFQLR